jgi:hypothetical protein
MRKRFGFKVVSDRPIPMYTAGSLTATGWHTAAKEAVREHIADLKTKGRNRKRCVSMTIKLWQEGTVAATTDDESPADQ